MSDYLCRGHFDQYSKLGADWTTEEPRLDALQAVSRLTEGLTFTANLLTTDTGTATR